MIMVRTRMMRFNDMKTISEVFINTNFHHSLTFLVCVLCLYSKNKSIAQGYAYPSLLTKSKVK